MTGAGTSQASVAGSYRHLQSPGLTNGWVGFTGSRAGYYQAASGVLDTQEILKVLMAKVAPVGLY